MNETRWLTTKADHGKFRAHGLVEARIEGDIAHYETWGPFNSEFVSALGTIEAAVEREMATRDRWAVLTVFHVSAMTSIEVLGFYEEHLKNLTNESRAPNATAFVITSDVEGGEIMPPLFAKCFAAADISFKVFRVQDEAKAWLLSML